MESEGMIAVRLRILIVESDRTIREWLTESLKTLGQEATPVSNSATALILLEPDQFDLMLLSCSSTDFDGCR